MSLNSKCHLVRQSKVKMKTAAVFLQWVYTPSYHSLLKLIFRPPSCCHCSPFLFLFIPPPFLEELGTEGLQGSQCLKIQRLTDTTSVSVLCKLYSALEMQCSTQKGPSFVVRPISITQTIKGHRRPKVDARGVLLIMSIIIIIDNIYLQLRVK